MTDRPARFRISLDDSLAFARLSGDFNPLHVDPVHARRLQFGATVVHGIHALLLTLDRALGADATVAGFDRLSVTFHNPVISGTAVDLALAPLEPGKQVRLHGIVSGIRAFTVTVTPSVQAGADCAIPDSSPVAGEALEGTTSGQVACADHLELVLDRELCGRLFPALSARLSAAWLAQVIATTRIVGMRCPGLHSIYAGLRLAAANRDAGDTGTTLRYAVERTDERFGLVRLGLEGPAFGGSLEAFFRPAPVDQPAMAEVKKHVHAGEFAGQHALVVGASRGVGETTAKVLAAGGARVDVAYARGREDAQRVVTDIEAAGGHARAVHLDVTSTGSVRALAAGDHVPYTHVYYFASPHITPNPATLWNAELHAGFTRVYVDGLAAIMETLRRAAPAGQPPAFFFPSTVYIDSREKGFAEYIAAKVAGESLCAHAEAHFGLRCLAPRLPRMHTDQTSGLAESEAAHTLPVMLSSVREFAGHTGRATSPSEDQ